MITKDVMKYKGYLKNHNEISIKLRVIKHRIADKLQIKDISYKYSMGRNTVTNIMRLYNSTASSELKDKIEKNITMSEIEILKLGKFLIPKSRKPKSHPKQANSSEEKQIIDWYEKTKVGAKRLVNNLTARKEIGNLSLAKVKGVYKRNSFKIQKVRTKNGETRALYDYEKIGAFDDGHYDTKELADSHSLPKHIYDNLQYNTNLPLYERNIMFAGCRARFTAYSRGKSSTFGLQFLVFVLSHLRYNGVSSYIHMHTDGGSEFFSGSKRK